MIPKEPAIFMDGALKDAESERSNAEDMTYCSAGRT